MKKLIKKLIVWAAQEKPRGLRGGIEVPANYSKSDFEWHANRIEVLEDNMRLLMNHLNVRVVNKGKQIVDGNSNGMSELTAQMPEMAYANKAASSLKKGL